MSEQAQEQGGPPTGTAVKALAAGAATAAATYAFRRVLSSRSGEDGQSRSDEDESPESFAEESPAGEGEADTDEASAEPERDDAEAGERDEAEDDDTSEPDAGTALDVRGSGSAKSRLQQVSASALTAATPALVPLAERAADSAGRYVAENAPEVVKDHVVKPLIAAFEEAS
jgi:hypothetical protein